VNVQFQTNVTYKEWVTSPEFTKNVKSAIAANTGWKDNLGDAAKVLRELVKKVPEIGSAKIELVCEVQLHLDRYVQARKKTHLWFKIQRAKDIYDLRSDCEKFVDAR
jgi:hypothetical protein